MPAHGERGLRGVADGDGAFRGELLRERVEHVVAAGEAYYPADVRVADLLARALIGLHESRLGWPLVDAKRDAHHSAQRCEVIQDRREIRIGQILQATFGLAVGYPQHNTALFEIAGSLPRW